jgi:hypothetical protein
MASRQVFVSSIFTFLFLLPQTTSSAVICNTSSCGGSENPFIMFPYRLKGTNNDQSCGYPGFDLSCNNQSQTILNLPHSGDVVVELIDYNEQSIYIADPGHCFARRFLDNFTLSWEMPSCGGCVARGGDDCALVSATSPDVGCFNVPTPPTPSNGTLTCFIKLQD